jgi:hypothetical protein
MTRMHRLTLNDGRTSEMTDEDDPSSGYSVTPRKDVAELDSV